MGVDPELMNVIAQRASSVIVGRQVSIEVLLNEDAVHLPTLQETLEGTNTKRIETEDPGAAQVGQTPQPSVRSLRNIINTNILDEATHKTLFQAIRKIQSQAEESIDTQNTTPSRRCCCPLRSWKNWKREAVSLKQEWLQTLIFRRRHWQQQRLSRSNSKQTCLK